MFKSHFSQSTTIYSWLLATSEWGRRHSESSWKSWGKIFLTPLRNEGIFYLDAYLKGRPHMSRVSWITAEWSPEKHLHRYSKSFLLERPHTWPDSLLHSNKCLSHCLPMLRPPDSTPILTFWSPLCLYSFANWNTFLCFFYVWSLGKPIRRALVHPHKKQFNWGDVMTQQDTRLEAR